MRRLPVRLVLPGRSCLALALALAAGAAPGLAQTIVTPSTPAQRGVGLQQQMLENLRDAQLRAQLDLAARQAVIQQNELSALEAQVHTDQALARLRAQAATPQILPPPPIATPRSIDVSGLVEIPDAALAASNARVRAASDNRP